MSLDEVSPYLRVKHRRQGCYIPPSLLRTPSEQFRRERELSALRRGGIRVINKPVESVDNVEKQVSNRVTDDLDQFDAEFAIVGDAFRWKRIIVEVCRKHGITLAQIMSRRREERIVIARHEAVWRLCEETSMSLPQVGRRLGGLDHSSVIHGKRKHEERMRNGTV